MRRALLISLLALILLPGMALASLSITSNLISNPQQPAPGVIDPFGTHWTITGPPFDCIRVGWLSGNKFLAPDVFTSFNSGWSQSWGYPQDAAAGGPPTSDLQYDMWHNGMSEGTSFRLAIYGDESWMASLEATYLTGFGWTNEWTNDWDPGKREPTPEPATWIAMLTGLGMLGVMRIRS